MSQFVRATSDILTTSWTTPGANYWSEVDEGVPGDDTYLVGPAIAVMFPDAPQLHFGCNSVDDPGITAGFILRYKGGKAATSARPYRGVLQLWQGGIGNGTLIADLRGTTHTAESQITDTYELSSGEAGTINFGLPFQFATGNEAQGGGAQAQWNLDFVELELPDAPGGVTVALAATIEHDTALPVGLTSDTGAVTVAVTSTTENDTASPLSLMGVGAAVLALTQADEVITANPLTLLPSTNVALPVAVTTEHDTASGLALTSAGTATIVVASTTEHDDANPIQLLTAGDLNVVTATEQDTANPLSLEGAGAATLNLATAIEHDLAQPLILEVRSGLTLATSSEHDRAFPLVLTPAGTTILTLVTATAWDRASPLVLSVVSLVDPNPIRVTVHDPRGVTIVDNT